MATAPIVRDLWAITSASEIVLFVLIFRRRFDKSHPAFFYYVASILLQSAFVALLYLYAGIAGRTRWAGYYLPWASQAVVVCARWLAVAEIARKAFEKYAGISKLASRFLLIVAGGVLLYALATSGSKWTLVILTADRSVELSIAAVVVGMFAFIRYYHLPVPPLERFLAIGFCLYSCFAVINLCIYENGSAGGPLWSYLDLVTFLATVLLWTGAVYRYSEVPKVAAESGMSAELYGELSPQLNAQLDLLNSRLDHLFRSGGSRP